MPKFNIPNIVEPLQIAEYAPGSEAVVWVWLNPPTDVLREHGEIIRANADIKERIALIEPDDQEKLDAIKAELDALLERRLAWFAQVWSQGKDPATHWTLDEVRELRNRTADSDPQFFGWLCTKTLAMIGEHRNAQKKISSTKP